MKFTIDFGKHDATGNGIKDNLVEVAVELKGVLNDKGDSTRPKLSICGTIWNRLKTDCISVGQNSWEIRSLVGFSPLMKRVYHIWERYHLNDMKAGSPRQEAYLAGYEQAFREENFGFMKEWDFDDKVYLLEKAGLQPDHTHNNYRYGSAWLYEPIPDDILAEIATWSKEGSE